MNLLPLVRILHIFCGVISLASLPIPAIAKKGSPLHRRAGWAFVLSIGFGAISGSALSGARLFDTNPKNDSGAYFLLYVSLFTASAAWFGVRALRHRLAHRSLIDLATPILLLGCGIALAVYGVKVQQPLFALFALLGVAMGVSYLRSWITPPKTKRDSILRHASAMGTAGIATVTAFCVVNAPHFGLKRFSLIAWVVPIVVGAILLTFTTRKYARVLPGTE